MIPSIDFFYWDDILLLIFPPLFVILFTSIGRDIDDGIFLDSDTSFTIHHNYCIVEQITYKINELCT